MRDLLKNATASDQAATPWLLLMVLGGFVFAGLFLFQFIALGLVMPFFNYDLEQTLLTLSDPFGMVDAWMPLMIVQGVTHIGTFILVPLFFIHKYLKLSFGEFFTIPPKNYQPVFMVLIIVFCFMVANSVVIEWNQNIRFPESLKWFEQQAQSKELQLTKFIEYLTSFSNLWEFLLALLIIAVVPAVGEELLFRGLMQPLFTAAFKNVHLAIWASALLFGLFHLQFYGVVPRMLLGVLFGYLCYWSGHLSIAMFAHFLNNGLTLFMLYLSQLNVIDYDPTDTSVSPPYYIILLFFGVGCVLLYLYKNYFAAQEENG